MKNGRCRVHGGASTGPKPGSTSKPGNIYSKYLTPDEQAAWNELELGRVENELKLMRIRLARALAAESKAGGEPELDEITQNDGGGMAVPTETRKSKTRDYVGIIDKITARIESLERTRKLLDDGEGEGAHDIEGFEVLPYGDHPAE